MSDNKGQTNKTNPAREIYDWAETFGVALTIVVLIFTFLCRFVTVDGHSMDKTLNHADRLIISDLFYTPDTGDIVVVHDTTEPHFKGPVIKRVIATAGETVDIDFNTWTVSVTDIEGNTRVLDEPYVNYEEGLPMKGTSSSFIYPHAPTYPHVVADGCVFVMGDNRNHSLDSRYVGDIDERMILGKAYLRLFPFNKIGFLK